MPLKHVQLCGAKTKTGPCKQPQMPNGKCRLHGGKSPPPGPDHPRWAHGRRSKLVRRLPGKLGETFAELEDEIADAFDLTFEARLLEARMFVLVEEMNDGGIVTGAELRALRTEFRRASSPDDIQPAMASLDLLIDRAERGDSTWREWTRADDLKRKLADTH